MEALLSFEISVNVYQIMYDAFQNILLKVGLLPFFFKLYVYFLNKNFKKELFLWLWNNDV
jgi:uncharacterized membrane protein